MFESLREYLTVCLFTCTAAPRGGLDNVSAPPAPAFHPSNDWSTASTQASGRGLHTSGVVDPTIMSTVNDMNTQFVRSKTRSVIPTTYTNFSYRDITCSTGVLNNCI